VPDLLSNKSQVLTAEAMMSLFFFQAASADRTWRTVS
jgi:hypothetical protein